MKYLSLILVGLLVIFNLMLLSQNCQLKNEIKVSDELSSKQQYNLELQDKLLVINEEIINMQNTLLSN